MIIRYTVKARADLADIYRYTLATWGEAQAERYLGGLEAAATCIGDGFALSRRVVHRDDLRTVRQAHHLIAYQLDDDGNVVILRVLHERMDIDRHLGDPFI